MNTIYYITLQYIILSLENLIFKIRKSYEYYWNF